MLPAAAAAAAAATAAKGQSIVGVPSVKLHPPDARSHPTSLFLHSTWSSSATENVIYSKFTGSRHHRVYLFSEYLIFSIHTHTHTHTHTHKEREREELLLFSKQLP